jgi:hypothetical protein
MERDLLREVPVLQQLRCQLPLVEAAVESPVPAAVFRGERQIDERPYRPVRALQGIAQLEQGVASGDQTHVQLRLDSYR